MVELSCRFFLFYVFFCDLAVQCHNLHSHIKAPPFHFPGCLPPHQWSANASGPTRPVPHTQPRSPIGPVPTSTAAASPPAPTAPPPADASVEASGGPGALAFSPIVPPSLPAPTPGPTAPPPSAPGRPESQGSDRDEPGHEAFFSFQQSMAQLLAQMGT